MIDVPLAARFTCAVEPPTDGRTRSFPAPSMKSTGNETAEPVLLVKYSAEYQPPPNAICGRTLDREFELEVFAVVGMEVKDWPKRSPNTATFPVVTLNWGCVLASLLPPFRPQRI